MKSNPTLYSYLMVALPFILSYLMKSNPTLYSYLMAALPFILILWIL